jgi:hypothetical protein
MQQVKFKRISEIKIKVPNTKTLKFIYFTQWKNTQEAIHTHIKCITLINLAAWILNPKD